MSETRRPTSVTLIALFVLGLALWNGLRLVQAIVFWSILKEYKAEPGSLYAALIGGVWFLAGLSIVWGLWQGKAWAWFAALGGAPGYASWYWFDKLVFQEQHSNWAFSLVSTVISMSFFSILFHRSAIHFFHQNSRFRFCYFKTRHDRMRITTKKENN
jgi:hypothetical protein